MELHITRITATDTDKEGNELKGKHGPFWRVGIQTKEYPDVWINGFTKNKPAWKVDDVVELDVRDEEYNGKMQKKFSFPKKTDVNNEKLEQILNTLVGIRLELEGIKAAVLPKKKLDYPENDVPPPFPDEDIPEIDDSSIPF